MKFPKGSSPFYGKKHSEETKKKMSITHTGTTLSEETKKKMSLKQNGKGNAFYNKKHSEISIEKMSEKKLAKFKEKYPKELALKIRQLQGEGYSKYRILKELNFGRNYYYLDKILNIYTDETSQK